MTTENIPTELADDGDLIEVDEIRLFALRKASKMRRMEKLCERQGKPEAAVACRQAGSDGQRLAREAARMLREAGQ